MKIFKVLLSRIFIFGIILLIQISWITTLLLNVSHVSAIIRVALNIISILVVLYIINKTDNPAYKMAWIIPILVMPLFGGLLYLSIGDKRPGRWLRRKIETEIERTRPLLEQDTQVFEVLDQKDPLIASHARYIYNTSQFPVYQNTSTKYYATGEDCYVVMLEELKKAKHFIFMEYFIVANGVMWQSILDILTQKAREGVEVRFMYDDVGSVTVLPYHYYKQLRKAGIQCMAFNPFVPILSLAMNNRDHRKITVIDGHTAFSGGFNLADEYINVKERFGYWKDTGFMIKGDAVKSFTMMFLQMWNAIADKKDQDFTQFLPKAHYQKAFKNDGFLIPYGDSPLDEEIVGENVYMNMIQAAKRYVYIFTPYLIIDNEMMTTLCTAAKRGVDVRIVTPKIPDKKLVFILTQSYYPQLIEAGVRIFEYTPGFIHAKSVVCDDEVAAVGTVNLDYRSFYLHFECGMVLYRSSAIKDIKQDVIDTLAVSQEFTENDYKRGFFIGLFRAVLRLFAPML